MKNIADEKEFFTKLLDMMAVQFGTNCEIVLHDLTKSYDSTIVDIRNNHSGRKIGDSGSNLGLEVLKGSSGSGDRYNYITLTKKQRIYRSSSMYFHNDEGKVIGALCINMDITDSLQFEEFLKQYNGYSVGTVATEKSDEYFADNVQDLLEHLIEKAQQFVGKPIANMTKDDKVQFLSWLDEKGAFLISKSSEYICDLLGISKFTFYKYLDASHTDN